MTRFPIPRPTENQAIGRASQRSTPTASAEQLRHRLVAALGALLLAHHIRRAVE